MEIEQLETRKIAGYNAIKLEQKQTGSAIEIIPGLGGKINGLWLSDNSAQQNIIDGYHDSDDLLNDTYYHNVWLFPFVNRMEAGIYEFNGKKYQFPINEPDRGNALHGFIFDKAFEVVDVNTDDEKPFIKLAYTYNGEFEYYPFPFTVNITYRFEASNTLSIDVEVKNTGAKSAPIGFGWHPYFTFSKDIQNINVTIPARKRVVVNENLIATGEIVEDDRFFNGKKIEADQLDDSFILDSSEENKVSLLSKEDQTQITLLYDDAIRFMQVFTPPTRKSIAIEPVTSNINAFNNRDGLLTIEPDETFLTNLKIKLTRTL